MDEFKRSKYVSQEITELDFNIFKAKVYKQIEPSCELADGIYVEFGSGSSFEDSSCNNTMYLTRDEFLKLKYLLDAVAREIK